MCRYVNQVDTAITIEGVYMLTTYLSQKPKAKMWTSFYKSMVFPEMKDRGIVNNLFSLTDLVG